MPVKSGRQRKRREEPETLSASEARQGDIVLSTPSMRAVFIAGLVLAIVIAAALELYSVLIR